MTDSHAQANRGVPSRKAPQGPAASLRAGPPQGQRPPLRTAAHCFVENLQDEDDLRRPQGMDGTLFLRVYAYVVSHLGEVHTQTQRGRRVEGPAAGSWGAGKEDRNLQDDGWWCGHHAPPTATGRQWRCAEFSSLRRSSRAPSPSGSPDRTPLWSLGTPLSLSEAWQEAGEGGRPLERGPGCVL